MVCCNCKKKIPKRAFFCSNCGKRLVDSTLPQIGEVPESAQTDKPQLDEAATAVNGISLLKMVNPLNGSTYLANVDPQTLIDLNKECGDDHDYNEWIDNLNGVYPVVKDVFKTLVKFTVIAGKIIFHMGKVILNFIMKLAKEFPPAITGIVAGFVLRTIFLSVPIVVWALAPIIIPIFALVGGIVGFMEDMSRKLNDADMERKIQSSITNKINTLGLVF
jgi:hypothetical protein